MKPSDRRVALVASVALAALSAASVLLYATMARDDDPLVAASTISFLFAPLVMSAVGAILTDRRPKHIIGWLFIFGAGGLALAAVPQAYALAAYATEPHLPFASAAVIAEGLFWPAYLPSFVLVFMLFPNGRALSRRWAIAGTFAVAAPIALIALSLFVPGPVGPYLDVRMPLALSGDAAQAFDAASGPLLGVLFLGPFVVSGASLVVRFRRSRGIERAQMKWLTFGVVAIIAMQLVNSSGVIGLWGSILTGASFFSLPFSIALAVLRYRLYDIDVLIRRTVIYAAVSAVLVATYVGGVAVPQTILAPLTTGNGVAVAISTLAVIALFQPLRTRIQSAVDRRFYRAKYDAERTLDTFAGRLRDHVELDSVRAELLSAVGETLQPSHASVWLREARP